MGLASRRPPASIDEADMPSVLEALHCLRVALTVFDADQRLIFANEHFNYLFRSLPPRQELIGKTYEEMIRLEVAGGEIAKLKDNEDFVAKRCAQLFAGDYVPRDVPLSDGRIIEIKTRRIGNRGWVALWTDVTQAQLNLNRLQAALSLTADAFAFYDRKDELILCNDEYAAVNGAGNASELFGCHFDEVAERLVKIAKPNSDAEAWLEKRREAHQLQAGVMMVELPTGMAYLLRDRATADGGRVVVFTDITEHHRAEKVLAEQSRTLSDTRQALARTKAETMRQADYLADLTRKLDQTAQSADSTKKTLLRTMSHELKTPLNAIIGFSDLLGALAEHATPDQIREYAGLIHQGGKNLLELINQILDLTKISAGRYEINRRRIDAGQMLWQAKENYEDRAEAKNIRIDTAACAPGLMVEADESAFGVMLNHLVENAVHFNHPGGEIRLSAERDGKLVRLKVADNGPGVPAEDLERILEPFEQVGRGTTDHADGTGLGLTLVKALSELQGGSLQVQSVPGEGFTAIIELPAAE
jgi:two-component system, cell cycle sensor histidine kinase PleC